jgi:ankyrin repeat protein
MSAIEEILRASEQGDVDKAGELIRRDPALVNAKGNCDKTPLHWAAEKNLRELAELLLAARRRHPCGSDLGHDALVESRIRY